MAFVNDQQSTCFVYNSAEAEALTTQIVGSFGGNIPRKVSYTCGSTAGGTYTVEVSIDGTTWDNPQSIVAGAGAKTSALHDNVHKWFRVTCPTSTVHSIRIAW